MYSQICANMHSESPEKVSLGFIHCYCFKTVPQHKMDHTEQVVLDKWEIIELLLSQIKQKSLHH